MIGAKGRMARLRGAVSEQDLTPGSYTNPIFTILVLFERLARCWVDIEGAG